MGGLGAIFIIMIIIVHSKKWSRLVCTRKTSFELTDVLKSSDWYFVWDESSPVRGIAILDK